MKNLNPEDQHLIEIARELIKQRYKENYHHVSSALGTKAGSIFTGIHLEGYIGRVAVCAEAIALGQAAVAGDTDIDLIVEVSKEGDVVSPCGICRELISDYSANARVIINEDSVLRIASVSELLPNKYKR